MGKGPGLTIFDMDETLLHTTANVHVIKNGEVIRKLNNQEFNNYKLNHGESLDFAEFSDAKHFRSTSSPIRSMLAKAKAILANVKRRPGSKMIILTARADFDDKEIFLSMFRSLRFDIDSVHVERAGNLNIRPAFKAKEVVLRRYLETYRFSTVRMFDDDKPNLDMMLNLENDYPWVDFEAYLVGSGGSVRRYRSL